MSKYHNMPPYHDEEATDQEMQDVSRTGIFIVFALALGILGIIFLVGFLLTSIFNLIF